SVVIDAVADRAFLFVDQLGRSRSIERIVAIGAARVSFFAPAQMDEVEESFGRKGFGIGYLDFLVYGLLPSPVAALIYRIAQDGLRSARAVRNAEKRAVRDPLGLRVRRVGAVAIEADRARHYRGLEVFALVFGVAIDAGYAGIVVQLG